MIQILASSAVRIAKQSGAKLIMLFSNTVTGVKYISKFRPDVPIIVITSDLRNAR